MKGRMLVIVPSHWRPERAYEQAATFSVASGVDIEHWIDPDDKYRGEYEKLLPHTLRILPRPMQFVAATNAAIAGRDLSGYEYIGSMTDKHLPRAQWWAPRIIAALDDLDKFGFAYPNDGMFGEYIPTACFMTRNVVDALGWLTMPRLMHFACDNIWRHLGLATGRIRYCPDVLVEMMHAGGGKSAYDFTQARSDKLRDGDLNVYREYMKAEFFRDVDKLNSLKGWR